jgi:CBS domain-containing protein
MNAGDVMTRRVVSIRPDQSVREAGALMLKHDIGGLPVVDSDGRLVGIVTERDFLRTARPGAGVRRPRLVEVLTARGPVVKPERRRLVEDIMTPAPVSVSESASLRDVVRCMSEHNVKRLPVLRDGRLVGIIVDADLKRALAKSLRKNFAVSEGDEELRSRMTEIELQSWLHRMRP